MSDVTAILVAGAAAGPPPPGAASMTPVGTLADVTAAAAAASTPLVWVLAATATPRPDALPALLEHAGVPAASLPVDDSGTPVDALIGRFAHDAAAAVLAEVGRHRVPLAHTPVVSLLVERDLVLDVAPPSPRRFGRHTGSEWTARLFARSDGGGVLVPASRVRVPAAPPADPLAAVRVLRAGGFGRMDVLREVRRGVARR